MEKRKWDMLKEDMMRTLRDLDEEAALLLPDSQRLRLVIVGGGALILMDVIACSTHDIDALWVSPQLRLLLVDYDINCDMQAYSCNFAYSYERRLQKLPIDGQVIDFYTASLEDIVIFCMIFPSMKGDTARAATDIPWIRNPVCTVPVPHGDAQSERAV